MGSNMIRVTGINSGLDTESIISAYTSTQKKRVQDAKNGKKLNEWKQDAWKSLNTKIYNFYSGTCANNRLSSAYAKTKTTTSNSALSVVTGSNASTGVQTAQIKSTASAGFLTGGEIGVSSLNENLVDTLGADLEGKQISVDFNNGKSTKIQIGGTSDDPDVKVVNTMDDLVRALKNSGLTANFDSNNKRLFLSSKKTGTENDFNMSGDLEALKSLGLATEAQGAEAGKGATKMDGSSAELILNGASFKSDTNSFVINGSTYTINYLPANTEEDIAINTTTDYDGVYNVVKDMLKEYNSLINEMSKLYNAESSKGYDPLTDEQKEEMSEKEIEEWENKIKGALLKSDSTVNDVIMKMTTATHTGFEVNGKTMFLSDFGIATAGYFESEENERYALHIDGDSDDGLSSGKTDKLKSMIAADPEAVSSFFSQFSSNLYNGLYSLMGSTKLSSIYKVYNDKQLKTEADDWNKKIAEMESKLTDMEDRYYKKFATMESTLAKVNSRSDSVSSFFGG